ncbi:hypothetical protein [Schaalia cardiffensis]
MNPAALLHDLLSKYRAPEGEIYPSVRWHISDDEVTRVISNDDRAALLEAARWLTRIDQLITGLDETGGTGRIFRKYYPVWVNSVFAIGLDWTNRRTANAGEVCPESAMDMLASFATLIDKTNSDLTPDAHVFLINLVADIRSILDEDDTLSLQLRAHMHRVLDHLDDCLANPSAFDPHDVAFAVDDVITAVKAAASETESDEHGSRWTSIRDKFIWPTTSAFVASAPGLILQIAPAL